MLPAGLAVGLLLCVRLLCTYPGVNCTMHELHYSPLEWEISPLMLRECHFEHDPFFGFKTLPYIQPVLVKTHPPYQVRKTLCSLATITIFDANQLPLSTPALLAMQLCILYLSTQLPPPSLTRIYLPLPTNTSLPIPKNRPPKNQDPPKLNPLL